MTAKVVFPPKLAVQRNTLICMGITAQDQQGPQESLSGFFCSMQRVTGSWSLLSDVCLSNSQGSPVLEPQQLPQFNLFQCYTTHNIRKNLLVPGLNLHANSNQLLLALFTTSTVSYFISPFSSLLCVWTLLRASSVCFNLNDPSTFLYRSRFLDFLIALLRILLSWSTFFLKDNAWN